MTDNRQIADRVLRGVPEGVPGEPCKLISAVTPDDGTDLSLMRLLREKKGVVSASSRACLTVSVLAVAQAKPGKLPEPSLSRVTEILVPEAQADELFELLCEHAQIKRSGGGLVFLRPAPFCTPYTLPQGLPEEER